MSADGLLRTTGLQKEFEGIKAIEDLSVSFDEDRLHTVIGPNGAGKTTFFNLITGALSPTAGEIHFRGENITDRGPEDIARLGIVRSYQTQQLFPNNSVFDNVRIAVQSHESSFNFWTDADEFEATRDRTQTILEQIGLADKQDEEAANLGHGEQRMLEMAIALGADPDLLLLDEPTSGMNAEETDSMIDLIGDLATDIPIILIEHKMSVVMEVADRILVLHNGQKIADGTPAEVRNDETVKRVYLRSN